MSGADGLPSSSSPFGEPVSRWSGRQYRTKGTPRPTVWDGERGVALPLRPPPWWYVPLFAVLTLGCVTALAVGATRLVRAQAVEEPWSVVAASAVLMLLSWLFALATKASAKRRRDPGQVVVTPTWLVADRVHAQWRAIDTVWARQEYRKGHLRPIDIASVHASGRTVTVYEAWQLDVEPRAALEALRHLHRDPSLRSRLSADAAVALFAPVATGAGRG